MLGVGEAKLEQALATLGVDEAELESKSPG